MNCNDINEALLNGSMDSPLPQAEEHLGGCEGCRELVGALKLPPFEAEPSREALREIEKRMAADLLPVSPIPARGYLFASLVAIFVCIVAVSVYRIGALALAVMSPVQAAIILGALAVCTGLLAYSLVNQIIPGSRHRISPGFLPIGIAISLAIVVALVFQFHHERNFWAKGWGCIRAGTPIAALAALPLWLTLRRGAILSPAVTGAATGLLAGLAGTTVLKIHCPNLEASHILVGHLGVAAIGAFTGFVLGVAAENSQTSFRRRNFGTGINE